MYNYQINNFYSKLIKFLKNNKLIVILTSIVLIGIVVIIFWPVNNNEKIEKGYVLTLFGDLELSINEGDKYIEPGYYAYYNDQNQTDKVVVSGSVNTNKAGVYTITYTIGDKSLTRKITVLLKKDEENIIEEEPEQEPIIQEESVIFKLNGESELEIDINTPYKDSGFIAKTSNGKNLTDYVFIDNQVNAQKEGTYYIRYTLNYNNKKYELIRKVVVKMPLSIKVTNNTSSYSKDKTLIVSVLGSDFSYLKLPDQTIKKDKMLSYKVSSNGTYTFYAYDTKGNYVSESIVVKTIDNNIDTASCILNVNVKSSSILINATDTKSGISHYKYNGTNYLTNKIDLNQRIKTASVQVYDKVGNYKYINCQVNIQEEIYGFILIGDSRFVGMETYLGSDKRSQDTFVAKGAMGWDWFKNTAIAKVNNILKKHPDRNYYILCNLGINDYKYHYDDANYAKRLSKLAKNEWKDHIVGYISVNPYANVNDTRNKKVQKFNERQKSDIDGIYYCDTYNGIGLSNFKPRKSSDTTHYNKKTSINIYNYIIKNCAY